MYFMSFDFTLSVLGSSSSRHMGHHRIRYYSVVKSLWRKVMSQVDLHVHLHVRVGEEKGLPVSLRETLWLSAESRRSGVPYFAGTETLEEEFTSPSNLGISLTLFASLLFSISFCSLLLFPDLLIVPYSL